MRGLIGAKLRGVRSFFTKARRILRYFKPYRKQWIVLFVIANFSTAAALINPLIVKYLIDTVLVDKKYAYLHAIMIFFVVITLLAAFLRFISNYYYTKLKLTMLYDIRNEVFQHLETLDVSFFKEKKLGDILSRLTADIAAIEQFVSLIFNNLIISVLTLIFIFIVSVTLHWQLTLAAVAFVPALVIVQSRYGVRVRDRYRIVREKGAEFLSFLQERLSIVPLIKLCAQEENELKREKEKAEEMNNKNLALTVISNIAAGLSGIIIAGSALFILWYGSYQVIVGALSIGSLIAIYTYIAKLFGPIGSLTDLNVALQSTMVSAERVFELLDIKPSVVDRKGAKVNGRLRGEISFKDVSFAYNGGQPVLKRINFAIQPGESIGLVGPSGVGKTTMINLIARLHDPTSGNVLIDGHDLRELQLKSLRDHVGMVTQEAILFNASIRENILYGKPEANVVDIANAAKTAGLHDFIISLDRGYDTEVGERGLLLSQGQRQRIALARAVLRGSRIFLLDEATASLDTESEVQIQRAISNVMKGRTTIIIAHRLSTIQSVDRIFVLSGKDLVEQGTFSELMAAKGQFYRLYMAQFGGFHAFQERLDYELKRAREYREALPILAVRIENFDHILSRVGDEKGEQILNCVSKKISENLREIDFMAADPQERSLFYVVMPRTGPLELEEMQRRIRTRIPKDIKLHFGIAVPDIHSDSTGELISRGKRVLSKSVGLV